MTNTLTARRIKELLEDIKRYEDALKNNTDEPQDMVAMAWTTIAIAKAKLTAMKGDKK
jgi:hypothetical protein